MDKRRIIFGDYDTAQHGPWTLSKWSLPEPAYQTNMVTVPGRDGPLDLSTALTDGEPRYGSRTLTATLECSEGTRETRLTLVQEIVNRLDGRKMNIVLPDDPTHHLTGRVSVRTDYNDLAHAAVTITAICDPWRYSMQATRYSWTATEAERTAVLVNSGRRVTTPMVQVRGDGAHVTLTSGANIWTLDAGDYRLPELKLSRGSTLLTYSGSGELNIIYQEAVL